MALHNLMETTDSVDPSADWWFKLVDFLRTQGGWIVKGAGVQSVGYDTNPATAYTLLTYANFQASANHTVWFVLQSPGSVFGATKEFRFTKPYGVGAYYGTCAFSKADGFSMSGVSDTTAPADTADIKYLLATSPTSIGVSISVANTQRRLIGLVDDTPPYSFFFGGYPVGGGAVDSVVLWDPLVSGTYPVTGGDPSQTDEEPYVLVCGYMDGAFLGSTRGYRSTANTGYLAGYLKDPGDDSLQFRALISYSETLPTYALGVNPHTAKDDLLALRYIRDTSQTTPTGWKGVSTLFRAMSTPRASGDTLNIAGTRDWIVLANSGPNWSWAMKWDGSIPLV